MTDDYVKQPIELEWTDQESGFTCQILRMIGISGHLCGYVAVPIDHPWYGKGYAQCLETPDPCIDYRDNGWCEHNAEVMIDVYGSITYAGELGERGRWYFGFDCTHSGDIELVFSDTGPIIMPQRTLEYVQQEVTNLAQQLYQHL
jgi:hypothetical protein